jgi:peptidoglycan/LPS O-acetylase OafA/YrhL
MELMRKLFFRRFSTEEFKQFREIYLEETKKLRKRVQFMVGLILLAAIMCYFLLRAFGFKDLQWPSTREVVGCVAGVAAGVFTAWLLLRWFKCTKLFKTYWLIPFGVFFLIFQFLMVASSSRAFEWEYLVYTLIILAGFICVNDSMREYFCERLLREQQKQH